jgi:hypothetical protein
LVRLLFNRFRWLLLGFCAAAMAAEQPQVAVKVDLTSTIGTPSVYWSVAFLTDRLLLISNGQSSPTSVLYDIIDRKVIRTGKTCGVTGLKVWGTFGGNVLAACNGGFVVYDQEFRPIAHFSAALNTYDMLLSPTRRFLAVNPLPERGAAKVLTTDILAEFATFPSKSGYIISLTQAGYIVYDSAKEKEGWELSFYPFPGSHPQSLLKSNKNCNAGFGISESEFLKLACGKERGKIIDITTGKFRAEVSDAGQADFAQAATSGKRFALGYQDYSKAHVVKQLANPLTYLAALGTCCDDHSNLFRLRIFDQETGNLLKKFHWKTSKNDPLHDRYTNYTFALSPNGEYVAFLRGVLVEVYRIPDKPS